MAFVAEVWNMVDGDGINGNGNGHRRRQWFNPQVNIGSIITLLVILGGGLLTLQRIETNQEYLTNSLNEIKSSLNGTNATVASVNQYVAGATEHTRSVDARLDQLEKNTQALSDRVDAQTNLLMRMNQNGLVK